jgi:predicted phosphoadenosine phosphosulfate sulfurtransferase
LYDLYYQSGVPLEKQRVASPFISEARESLSLYRAIDPDMWGKMINRINGVNFTSIYGTTNASGWRHKVKLPPGYTWERYMYFLLTTLPEKTRQNYLSKLAVSKKFWREKGGCLSEDTIQKLQAAGITMNIGSKSNYHTQKRSVRMEYIDDIDVAEFKDLPTYKRVCICILRNDHTCKYMGFAPTKSEKEMRMRVMEKYIRFMSYE